MDILDEALNEEEATSVETVAEETEQVAQPPRDETGKFAPKGEDLSASPAPVEDPPFDHAAVKAERQRRQDAERERDELRKQIEASQTPAEERVSLWDDDAKWQEQFGSEISNQAVSQATFNAKLDTSEMLARDKFDDFDARKEEFLALAKENPALTQQALQDPHPWRKAYQLAKSHATMTELGATDVESLRAKIREELEAEMAQKPPVQIPSSLAGNQSSRGNNPDAPGPISLDQILGG